jgi:manganese transport protein
MGEQGTEKLLILSQVILSFQLSFAVVPLVLFTGSRKRMGEFVNGRGLQALAWVTAAAIAGLNVWLLVETALGR